MSEALPARVLFVCLGNICRSPTAHGVFQALVDERGMAGRISVDSCGTGSWHVGEPPDRLLSTSPSDLAAATVRRVVMVQSRYWSCMYPKEPKELGLWTDRLHGEFS